MQQIVECIPNFSDGRRPQVYNAIAGAIRGVSGVQILDLSADHDHNRTVITFVGPPDAVAEAAFRSIKEAAQLINLDEHQGEHPRIGATDVCPFVPVNGVTLQDCVALAERLGRRVGQELGIAVYLYGAAATRPDRESLSKIRKGQYEKWRDEVATNPDRQPDFGPAEPQPWGATVIGARPFLIAYNLYLNSDDVALADQIARNIRFSSGGLRYVQAKGFLVDGQAQVSMNLTNFEKTPIHQVQELVRREAAVHGLTITRAELIGLSPQKALLEAAKWYLQLHELQDDQILEHQLLAADETADFTPHPFIEATAAAKPTPGGGSTAALAGALAAALAQMVAGITAGRKKYADVEAEAQAVLDRTATLRRQLTEAISQDAAAFDALMAAWRNRDLAQEARDEAIEQATVVAGEIPLQVARLSHEAAGLARTITRIGNINAISDAAAGAVMARAAVQIAAMNVKINGNSLRNRELAQAWREEVDRLTTETRAAVEDALVIAAERGDI